MLIVLWYVLKMKCNTKIEIPCNSLVLPCIMFTLTFEAERQIYLPLCSVSFLFPNFAWKFSWLLAIGMRSYWGFYSWCNRLNI
jgi:hypothetical protein